MFQEKRTLIFLDMTDFIKKLEVSIYFHRPLFTKRRLSSINSTPRIERRLETTLPRLESILKKSCGRASPKEISTGFIWKWWYLRRLPGHNRDCVHTRFNRPWHSPIRGRRTITTGPTSFTNHIFGLFQTIGTPWSSFRRNLLQPFFTPSIARDCAIVSIFIIGSLWITFQFLFYFYFITCVYLYTQSWTKLSGHI